MSRMQRSKGKRGELEVCHVFQGYDIPARRISMMETQGIDKGDIEIAGVYKAQVKLGGHVPTFHYQALAAGEMLIARRDKSKWLVTMPLDTFIEKFMGGNKK